MKHCILFIYLYVVFVSNTYSSLHGSPLQLKELVKKALERNPDLAAVRARVKAATFVVPRVQVLDDPKFTFRSMGNPIGSKRDFDQERGFIPERRYKFSQKIPFPGKLRAKGQIAQHQLEFIESEEITTHQELILQIKKLYVQLYLNKIARQINQQNKDIISQLINGLLAFYETGKGKQADVLKAQIELQMLDEELFILDSERVMIVAMLNALMDNPQSEKIRDPDDIISSRHSFTYEELEAIAMDKRPELQGIEAMADEYYAEAKLARLEYFPDFTFMFMIQHKPDQNKNAWGFNIGLNLPIWIGQRQKREVEEAEAKALASTSTLYGLRAIIQGKIKELLAKIEAAQERIDLYKTGLIPKTAQMLASYESQYRVAKEEFATVLAARRQLQDTEFTYEHIRMEREILLAELERAVGMTLDDISQPKPRLTYKKSEQKEIDKPVPLTKRKKVRKAKARKKRKQNIDKKHSKRNKKGTKRR